MSTINKEEEFLLYTDGATSNNGADDAIGGWAWTVVQAVGSSYIQLAFSAQKEENTTNNICELKAVIEGCKYATERDFLPITVYSDSAYIVNCYKDKWYKKWIRNDWVRYGGAPVKNRELWEQLVPFFENPNFKFEKVKGHSTNLWNNLVDKLAVEAKQR